MVDAERIVLYVQPLQFLLQVLVLGLELGYPIFPLTCQLISPNVLLSRFLMLLLQLIELLDLLGALLLEDALQLPRLLEFHQ